MQRFPAFAALLLAACAPAADLATAPAATGSLPTGARLSPEGFLTIAEAPPSPYPADPPPEPPLADDVLHRLASPDPAVRRQAEQEANGSLAFQAELQRLQQLLPRAEPDNFVQVRIVRDPAVAAEVWFVRDAALTLARYTSDPLFRPREGGISVADQERLSALWQERARGGEVIDMLWVDAPAGVVNLGVTVAEPEFRRIAAERGWELGPNVKANFPRPQPPAFADPSLAPLVRVFARESRAKSVQLTAGYSGRIVLEDGCFRLGGPAGPLVQFGHFTQVQRDPQGYLIVIGDGGRERYRIGEIGSWPGPNDVDENDPDVKQLRQHCGEGPIVNVAEPGSERLTYTPYANWVVNYARARSLSYQQAWDEVIACMERQERRGRTGLEARDGCIRQFN